MEETPEQRIARLTRELLEFEVRISRRAVAEAERRAVEAKSRQESAECERLQADISRLETQKLELQLRLSRKAVVKAEQAVAKAKQCVLHAKQWREVHPIRPADVAGPDAEGNTFGGSPQVGNS
jgi:hypothetical protein